MKDDHKMTLVQFILRTPMFIHPVTPECIESFVHGYELGTKESSFSTQLKTLLTSKYGTAYSSDGWKGQISRFSLEQSLDWITVFKRAAAEVLLGMNVSNMQEAEFKSFLLRLSEQIREGDNAHFESRLCHWKTFYLPKTDWFKRLWNEHELSILLETENYLTAKTAKEINSSRRTT